MIQTTMKAPVLYGPHFGWAIGHVTFRSVFHRVTTMPRRKGLPAWKEKNTTAILPLKNGGKGKRDSFPFWENQPIFSWFLGVVMI